MWSKAQQSISLLDGRAVVGEVAVNDVVQQSDCADAILDSVTSARIELSEDRVGGE